MASKTFPRRLVEATGAGDFELLAPGVTTIFPKRWAGTLGSGDVGQLLDVEVAGPPTRAEFCPVGWSLARFERFVEERKHGRKEASNVGKKGRILLLFEGPGALPVGGMVFDLTLYVTRSLAIRSLWLDLTLAWISPEHRGRGLGTRLAAHLCDYMEHHMAKKDSLKFRRGGVEVIIDADWTSAGGKRLTDHVHNYMEAVASIAALGGAIKGCWPVCSVELDAGY